MSRGLAKRTDLFGSCIIRLSSVKTAAVGGINLAQGFPEQNPPLEVVEACRAALAQGKNQYADLRGLSELRTAIAAHRSRSEDSHLYDPETEVTVTCGATEAMAAALHAIAEPGDEVLVQEPVYENYPPQIILAGARPRFFRLSQQGDQLDVDEIRRLCGPSTKAIILNTPNNPTGRVFSKAEIEGLASLCLEQDLYLLVDEVYEHLTWDGRLHCSPAAVSGMRDRTVVIGSLSKTYAATGWRVGWALAPKGVTSALRRAHDFLTGCAPTAAQYAAVVALNLSDHYYSDQRAEYERRRGVLSAYLERAGLRFAIPEGTYYLWVDVRSVGYDDSDLFAQDLLKDAKVGIVPWPAFFREPRPADRARARFNFAKSSEVLKQAGERIVDFAMAPGRRHRGAGV